MGPDAAEGVGQGCRLEIADERDRMPAYAECPSRLEPQARGDRQTGMDCPNTIQWPAACTPIYGLQLIRAPRTVLDPIGVLIGIDFLQFLRQFKLNVVQAHFPLLDPGSHLDALLAVLPSLGFRANSP
jgi:hypothetical protein